MHSLTIDPSANASPTIVVDDPPVGDIELVQSIDSYSIAWTASDPESNEIWTSVWVNTAPVLDGNEVFLETSLHTPADLGLYILSTTYLPVGTYYVYAEVTDGGSKVGDWSEGTLTLVPQPVSVPTTGVIRETRLLPSTPNPFNPSTLLRLELDRTATIVWDIYDQRGARVRRLSGGHLHAGVHERTWDGRDDGGRHVASGIYFASVRGSGIDLSQKLVLLK